MNISLASLLSLRTEYEEIIRRYRIPDEYKKSDIHSLVWFKSYGKGSNRLRSRYDRAIEIANIILEEYEYEKEKSNISSIRGKEVQAL
jgi:hypothetical protein